jgi:formylglycine-generating enzyme required for sulfatase activity
MRNRNKSLFFAVVCVLALGHQSFLHAEDHEEVTTLVGEEFKISLDSNPSTGYSWSLAEHLPDWLELLDKTYVATDPGVIGGGGTEIWTFRATGSGSATLTFEYQRPWEDKPIQTQVYQVTAKNPADMEKIDVLVGEEFRIGLESNPSTGYSWSLAEHLPDWLEQVDKTYVATDPGMIGGGGTETWTFRATGSGSATLTFEYQRPWEDKPIQTHVCQVTARAQEPNAPAGIVFVKIPAGTFQMGDIDGSGYANERPVHTVTLRGFEMSKYETTNAQYAAYLNDALARGAIQVLWGTVYATGDTGQAQPYCDTTSANPYSQIEYNRGQFSVRTRNGRSMSDHPAVQVSWYGAKAFCDYYGCRLPTEAEWEYAARGGYDAPSSLYPWGSNGIDCSKANGNLITYCNPVGLMSYPYTSPVGFYGPQGAYGLCDMCGNVWEFCVDWYSATYYSFSPAGNPPGPVNGKERVVRGGSWDKGEYRVANRSSRTPASRTWDVGLRVCR